MVRDLKPLTPSSVIRFSLGYLLRMERLPFTELPSTAILRPILSAASAALDVEDALVHEGDGVRRFLVPDRDADQINANGDIDLFRRFVAISTVEHSGDEEGISSRTHALAHRTANFKVKGDECSYTVTVVEHFDQTLVASDRDGDDEYSVRAGVSMRLLISRMK